MWRASDRIREKDRKEEIDKYDESSLREYVVKQHETAKQLYDLESDLNLEEKAERQNIYQFLI